MNKNNTKSITSIILGVATLVLALGLNFRHALNDYGILDNKLHTAVLAQTSGSGGSSTGGESTQSKESVWDVVNREKTETTAPGCNCTKGGSKYCCVEPK